MKVCAKCDSVYKNEKQKFCPVDGGILEPLKLLNDRYEIISELGRGGMGAVYRANDRVFARDCVIKAIHTFVPQNQQEEEMFYIKRTLSNRS